MADTNPSPGWAVYTGKRPRAGAARTLGGGHMARRKRGSGSGGPRAGHSLGLAAAALISAAAAAMTGVGPAAASQEAMASARLGSGDSPAGFWYGTDSSTTRITGSGPYSEPAIGGAYGGYIGMTGNWAHWLGCGKIVVWSSGNAAQAYSNYVRYHLGIGTGVYWFMAGPGVDPRYNGTTSEAYAFGQLQAARVLANVSGLRVNYPVIFADIEIPGNAPNYTPAYDNGWNTVYTSPCGGRVRSAGVAPSVDRAVLTGFAAYVTSHSKYKVGVYSAPDIWNSIFGTGAASLIPNTYEWTYESFTSSLAHRPSGWCLSATPTCARFFGGQTSASRYALMWQWSGGGGSYNGYGDLDQIDANRTP